MPSAWSTSVGVNPILWMSPISSRLSRKKSDGSRPSLSHASMIPQGSSKASFSSSVLSSFTL